MRQAKLNELGKNPFMDSGTHTNGKDKKTTKITKIGDIFFRT